MSDTSFCATSLLISSSPSSDKCVQTPGSDGKSNLGAIRALKNEVANLQCETSYLQSELDLTKNELNKCKNEAEAKGRRILRLENELFAAQSGKPDEGSLRRRRRSAVGRERELREEVRMLEAVNSTLNGDLDAAHSNAHVLTEKVTALEREKLKLVERNEELEETIALLNAHLESNAQMLSGLQIVCQDLKDVLEENCNNSTSEKRSLNTSLLACDNAVEEPLTSVVEIKYAELETQFRALESDLEEAKTTIKNKDLELFNLKKHLDTKMAEIAVLKEDLDKERSTNQAFDGSKIQLEEMVKLLKEEIKALNFGISTKKTELGLQECRNFDLQHEVYSLNNLMFGSEMELISLKRELSVSNSNVSKCENSIKGLEEMIEYYKLEKSSLEASVESLNERMSDLSADNQYITALNEALVLDTKNQKVQITRLQSDKIDDSKKLAILTSLYDETKLSLDQKLQQISQLEEKVLETKLSLDQKLQQISQLEEKVLETKLSLDQKLQLISQLEEKIVEMSQDKVAIMDQMNKAMQALETTLAEQKSVNTDLESKVTAFEKDVEELKSKNNALNQQIVAMHKEDERSCEIMKNMTEKLTAFESKIKFKCEKEKELEVEIGELKSSLKKTETELSARNDSLAEELKSKETEITSSNQELNKLKELYNSAEEELKLLKADSKSKLEVQSQELESLKAELEEARKSLSSHAELVENHKKACELQGSLIKELDESKKSIEAVQKELDCAKIDAKKSIEAVQKELDCAKIDAKKCIETVQKELDCAKIDAKKSIEAVQKELNCAKIDADDRSKLLCDSRKKINELSSLNYNLKNEIMKKEEEINTLNQELDTLKELYNSGKEEQKLMKADSKSKLEVKSQELESLKNDLAEARKSLEIQSVLIENHKKTCELQETLKKELEESKKSIDSLQLELGVAKIIVDEHSKLQNKLSELQKTHESALKELQDREANALEKLDAEQKNSSSLQQRASEFETEFRKAQSKCDELVAKIAQDALTIVQKDEMVDCLNSCLRELTEALKISCEKGDAVKMIANIKAEIESVSKERDSAVDELMSSQQELQAVKAQMVMLKEENVNLTDQLEQAQSNLAVEVDINCDLKKELDIMTAASHGLKTDIAFVSNQLGKKDSDIKILNIQLESEIKDKEELSSMLNKTEHQLKEIDENFNKVIEKIKSDHSLEVESKNSEIQKLNDEIETMSGTMQDLRAESEMLLGSLDKYKESTVQDNSYCESMSENRNDNFSENTSFKRYPSSEKLQNGHSENIFLKESICRPQASNERICEKEIINDSYVHDLSEKLIAANQEIKRLTQEYEVSQSRVEFLSNEIVQLTQSNEQIAGVNSFLKSSVTEYENKVAEYISKIKLLEDRLIELDKDVSEKILVDDNVFHDFQVLQHEIDLLKENSSLTKDKAQLADSLNCAIQKCRDLIKMLQVKDEIISCLSVNPSSLLTLTSNINLETVTEEMKQTLKVLSDAKFGNEKSSLELINQKLTEEVMAQETKLSIIRQKLEQSNDTVSRKAADISILECEKRDYLMEIRQLQTFISDLSVILSKEHNTSLDTVVAKNDVGDAKDDENVRNTRLLCYDNYRCLKRLLQTIHQVFGDESIIVRGDNMFIDNLSETEDSSVDFDWKELDELSLLEKEQRIIYVIKDQLEMVHVVLKEKNERLSQLCRMRSDAEANLRVSKERAVLLEDEIFKLQLEFEGRESYIKELEKLRLHETGLLRTALETREATIDHLHERISFLEDSESRLIVELKVKVEDLTKLSYDLGTKLKQAYFDRDAIATEASTKEASLNKNLTLLENLIKEKEEENLKLIQSIKMLEHEKSVLDRRVCFLTKDLEELKKLNSPVVEEFEASNELQLTDEQKLTLKPSIQKELRSCFKSAMEEAIAESDDLVSIYKEKLREAETHIEELSVQLWETADKQVESQQQIEVLSAQLASLQNKLDTMSARALDRISIGLEGVDNPGLEEISDDQIVMPPEPGPQSSERASAKRNVRGRPQANVPRFSMLSGKVFPVADEEEEMFDETCLSDLKAGIVRLNTKPQARYMSMPPQFVDDPRLSTGARSLQLTDRPKKEIGQITYHKPGPPTPSKNGRLSLSEMPPHMSTDKGEAAVDCDKENHGKIRNLFTAKSKSTQVPPKKKGFFRRKFGRENSSSNV